MTRRPPFRPTGWAAEVALADGAVLRLGAQVSVAWAAALLQALRRPCLETGTERLEPAEKICPHCGQAKGEIGCEKSERFEYLPARIVRHEILRPKPACPCGAGGVSVAPLPPSVVPQGQPGPGLVAQVLLSQYDDHRPLYRQPQPFARLGANFPRQTLCDGIEQGAAWLQPIVRAMKRALRAGDYLPVDEPPARVRDPEVKGRCAPGHLWVAGRPGSDVNFEFHPGRGKVFAPERGAISKGICNGMVTACPAPGRPTSRA